MNCYEKAIRAIGTLKTGPDLIEIVNEIACKNPKAVSDAFDRLHPLFQNNDGEIGLLCCQKTSS